MRALLFKAIFRNISLRCAKLPYNLSWQLRKPDQFATFLNENPIVVVDVGARGVSIDELETLRPYIDYIGFDADEAEAHRLSSVRSNAGFHSCRIFHSFIGGSKGSQLFHLYRDPEYSSSFQPDLDFKEAFGNDDFAMERSISVESRTLDQSLDEASVKPDVVKLDTQGSELAILRGSPAAVQQALLVEVEVEFTRMYQGQPLYHDIGLFMDAAGFELLYLNRVFAGRRAYEGYSRGQVIFGDALFGKTVSKALEMPDERQAKYAICLLNYGHVDMAHALCAANPRIAELVPKIKCHFKRYDGFLSKLKRAFWMQIDKVIALVLCFRRTNQMRGDSDRSWPIR